MMSQMHLVQNAARLAMADHRAAGPRRAPPAAATSLQAVLSALLSAVAMVTGWVSAAD